VIAALLIAGCVAAAPVARPPHADASASLDSIVTRAVANGFAGSVRVVRGSRVLLERSGGFADRERRRPNAGDTRYEIGSLTKQFTAAAVLLLQERGVLHTTDAVTRWLPEASPHWDAVTLHALLTHTAGIPDSDFDDDTFDSGPRDSSLTAGEWAVRLASKRPLEFAPGTRFAYSNMGYMVLGRVIERASGMRYEAFVTRNLLVPLGLAHTGFTPAGTPPDAIGYSSRRGPVVRARRMNLPRANAAGGLWSTTGDLVAWEQALFGGHVLSAASLATLTSPVIGDYACGIHHRTSPGREVLYHTGRTIGFDSVLGWYPQDSVAIAVLTNLDGAHEVALYDALAAASHNVP